MTTNLTARLLVWDIDGTLINAGGLGRRAMDMAFFDLYGIPEGFREINMAGMLDAVLLDQAYRLHGVCGRDPAEFFNRYAKILAGEVRKLNRPVAAPGIPALLKRLENCPGFHHVLGTGNIEAAARLKLSLDRLNGYFPTGGFGSELAERWQVIRTAIERARQHFGRSFHPSGIYIIGDTPRDIQCGKILGVKTVGVATGSYTCEQLAGCGADFVFTDLSDHEAFLRIFP